ncbi:MAG: Gfo/Idh/MocA family oxidoreductase [Verrucomicrobia bacterium]|jgi:predicted dehydrogenase|nr:Gfo/Idh/MocA family oxidoreductase [Verrucomicrobiota bacterium]
MNRRSFLKTSTAAGAGAFVMPSFSIGQAGASANSKLNIAMIGAGNIASMAYSGCRGENIVALCDVDSKMFAHPKRKYPAAAEAATFTDFRVMLDKMGKEIDAVCINTPDHTHFVATIAAMERGMHVCTQKPLTHNIWEARTLRKAQHKYNVITNMGNQGHTCNGIRQMREWVEADVFGQISEVHSWMKGPGTNWRAPYFGKPAALPPAEQPVPANLDYDLWLGPAAQTPFNGLYHPKKWRGFNPFGTGQFGDWFCHVADAPVWILDLYEPTVIEAEEVAGGNEWLVPDGCRVRFDFPKRGDKPPCSFYWHNGDAQFRPAKPESWTWGDLKGGGSLYMGTKQIGYTDERSNNPRLADREAMKVFKEAGYPAETYPRVKGGSPHLEWVRAIKGEGPEPGSNFDYAAPMTEIALLGVLAARFGGKLEWDSKNMRITNRPELNAFVREPVRKGWEYGQDLWKNA